MALRDIALFIILMGSIPVVLYRPWVGILLWYWIGLMNPHRLTWGFMYSFPVAALVAATVFLGCWWRVIARASRSPPRSS
ncbi:MAG: DUF5935 domain-containing protein [Halofilum sp. (in: g-proteobacteria)]|nr:DUF5935 domain-containing protein [Halofilum sp. (in: g-proteobacteria)]